MPAMTRRRRQRIGLLGGTFNPVHIGHLLIAQDALEQLELDGVTFIPCAAPPHKAAPNLASGPHRLAMLRWAVRGQRAFRVDDIELRRGGVSYSVDTVTELKRRNPDTEFYFIIGADSLDELHRWKEIGRLAEMCEFVAVARPGCKLRRAYRQARCRLVQGHACDVASREIRERVARGAGIRYLVPETVLRYIARHKLYQRKGTTSSKRAS